MEILSVTVGLVAIMMFFWGTIKALRFSGKAVANLSIKVTENLANSIASQKTETNDKKFTTH